MNNKPIIAVLSITIIGLLLSNRALRHELEAQREQNALLSASVTAAAVARPSPAPDQQRMPVPAPAAPALDDTAAPAAQERPDARPPGHQQEARDADRQSIDEQVEARVEERLATQHALRREQRREHLHNTIEDFVEAAELDAEVGEEMVALMEDTSDARREIMARSREEQTDMALVREEIDALHEETEIELVELLGEEDAETFLSELRRRSPHR